jgi:hypothetical protein
MIVQEDKRLAGGAPFHITAANVVGFEGAAPFGLKL